MEITDVANFFCILVVVVTSWFLGYQAGRRR